MNVMRVDNPEHNHDHSFGIGAGEEAHEIGIGDHTVASHGLFEHLGDNPADLGVHDVGHLGGLEHDFGQHHDTGFDGLHDSVHSIGLGFGGEEHGLHDSLHDTQHDAAPLGGHHEVVDTHHDVGLGGEHFHHG